MTEKKLYIFTNSHDVSTSKVMNFLPDRNVIRLNAEDAYYVSFCDLKSVILKSKKSESEHHIGENDKVWFRQGVFTFDSNVKYFSFLSKYLFKEAKKLQKSIFYVLAHRKEVYGSVEADYNHNKLIDILIARDIGFVTPQSFLVDSSSVSRLERNDFITKSIHNPKSFQLANSFFSIGKTTLLNPKAVHRSFSTSLLQELIPKKYEVRSFVFSDRIYSMCIFSQNSNESKVDFRSIGDINNIRLTPYNLPEHMEDKISRYMERKGLNSGSFDFIVTPQNDYIFLELNPVGQFDWLSYHCNYHVEKFIASKLRV